MAKRVVRHLHRSGTAVSALLGIVLLLGVTVRSPAQDTSQDLDLFGLRTPPVSEAEILPPERVEAAIIETLSAGGECVWLDSEVPGATLELGFQATVLFSRSMPDIELVLTAVDLPEAGSADGVVVEWKGDVVGAAEAIEAGERVSIPLVFNLAKADSSRMELRIRGAGPDAAAVVLSDAAAEDPTAGPHLLLIDHYRRR